VVEVIGAVVVEAVSVALEEEVQAAAAQAAAGKIIFK
jgi:hypothetical protein